MAIECIQCGYDLSGLADEGVCPECQKPVRFTRDPESRIAMLPERWVRSIVRGCVFMRAGGKGIVAALACLAAGVGLCMLTREPLIGVLLGVPVVVAVVCGVIGHLVGVFAISASWASDAVREEMLPAAIRIFGAAMPVAIFASISLGLNQSVPIAPRSRAFTPIETLFVVEALAQGVCIVYCWTLRMWLVKVAVFVGEDVQPRRWSSVGSAVLWCGLVFVWAVAIIAKTVIPVSLLLGGGIIVGQWHLTSRLHSYMDVRVPR